jgi:FkbM family methyltransferase
VAFGGVGVMHFLNSGRRQNSTFGDFTCLGCRLFDRIAHILFTKRFDMLQTLKNFIYALLAKLGYEIHRIDAKRSTMLNALRYARKAGLNPKTVIDVGAARGTPVLYQTFPQARHILFEPLGEYKADLDILKAQYADLNYTFAAATESKGTKTFYMHDQNPLYSSFHYGGIEHMIAREVPTVRVDDWCLEHGYSGPYVLKIDVQGAEVNVLRGAEKLLPQIDYIIAEIVLTTPDELGEIFHNVMAFMMKHDFVLFEVLEPAYRPSDLAPLQFDAAFVPRNSPLRQPQMLSTILKSSGSGT